jgi:polyhydroxybutyrate depolymerase
MDGTGYPLQWNSWLLNPTNIPDDVQFFRDVVTDLSQFANVDPSRIYVNGFSNGGGMAIRIACEAEDIVAAAGSVSGVITAIPDNCAPSRPVPLIAFHGTEDPILYYEGGEASFPPVLAWLLGMRSPPEPERPRSVTLAAEVWVAEWAELNGCLSTKDIPATGDTSSVRYADCRDDAGVVFYTIGGGGHTWPGGGWIPLMGKTSQDISASAAMWGFFETYSLMPID